MMIWKAEDERAWLEEPQQERFRQMMGALPAMVAKRLRTIAYMDAVGAFPEPSPCTLDELYGKIAALLGGAGIAYGRGGQSWEDYMLTVQEYLALYAAIQDALGATERYKKGTFDSYAK